MKRFVYAFPVVAGLAGLAAALAIAASSPNLVVNGGAEGGPTPASGADVVAPAGWTTAGTFTVGRYGFDGFPSQEEAAAIRGGANLFAGGPDNAQSSATQTVKVPAAWVKAVSTGRVRAKVSAALGGWDGQPDAATVTYVFLKVSGAVAGSVKIGPITPAQRAGVSKLIPVTKTVAVPAATRSVKITIMAIRGSGAYNDGYADNVSLILVR